MRKLTVINDDKLTDDEYDRFNETIDSFVEDEITYSELVTQVLNLDDRTEER